MLKQAHEIHILQMQNAEALRAQLFSSREAEKQRQHDINIQNASFVEGFRAAEAKAAENEKTRVFKKDAAAARRVQY